MRLAFRIDTHFTALGAALCVALASMTLPLDVFAEDAGSGAVSGAASGAASRAVSGAVSGSPAASVGLIGPALTTAAPEASNDGTPTAPEASADTATTSDTQAQNVPADASANDMVLDDQVLSRQRGGAVGMVMVAAAPQLRGNGVTLWDEIAPPTPLPVPVDAARAQQGSNVASYLRK